MSKRPAAAESSHPDEYLPRFDENPARFIYHMDPRPRIRGIRSVDLLREYARVVSEAENEDLSVRKSTLIAAINERISQLEALDQSQEQRDGNVAVATDGGTDR